MLSVVLLGIQCILVAASTIPAGSISNYVQIKSDVEALNAGLYNIAQQKTPTSDKLTTFIAEMNDPSKIFKQDDLEEKKAAALQTIDELRRLLTLVNTDASRILEKYNGQTGEIVDKIKAAADGIRSRTSAIESQLGYMKTATQSADSRRELQNAISPEGLDTCMFTLSAFLSDSQRTLDDIAYPAEDLKEKLDAGLGNLNAIIKSVKQAAGQLTLQFEEIKNQIVNSTSLAEVEDFKTNLQSQIDNLRGKVFELKAKASAFAENAPNTIDSAARTAVEAAKNASQVIIAKANAIYENLNQVKEKISSASNGSELRAKLSIARGTLRSTVNNILRSAKALIHEAIDDVQEYLSNFLSGTREFLSELFNGLRRQLDRIGNRTDQITNF